MTRFRLLLLLGLLGVPAPSDAGTFRQSNGPATLEVRCEAAGKKLALADMITVTLTIGGSPALNVYGAPLDLGAQAKWLLVERLRDTRQTVGPERVRWQLVYRFAPREPGHDLPFLFPDVRFRDGTEQTATWMPIAFEVESLITTPDPTKLRGVPAIEELPPVPNPEESAWTWLLIGPCLLPLVLVIVVGLSRLFRRAPARSATQLAIYEWDRLVGMKLPEKGQTERFITLLTILVRRYLERQFALAARRQTTPEFLQALATSTALTSSQKQFLTRFLERCECVKFAQAPMLSAECAEWAEATRQFLQAQR